MRCESMSESSSAVWEGSVYLATLTIFGLYCLRSCNNVFIVFPVSMISLKREPHVSGLLIKSSLVNLEGRRRNVPPQSKRSVWKGEWEAHWWGYDISGTLSYLHCETIFVWVKRSQEEPAGAIMREDRETFYPEPIPAADRENEQCLSFGCHSSEHIASFQMFLQILLVAGNGT